LLLTIKMEKKIKNKKQKKTTEIIKIPKGIEVKIEKDIVIVKGSKGEIKRQFRYKQIKLNLDDDQIKISSKKNTKREKTIIGTLKAHIKNMIKGVNEPHKYVLKICSGHFPVNVSVSENEIIVKNFLGEKIPRILKLKEGVNVKVDGDIIIIESVDKKLAGQVSADIEQLTKRRNYDTRIFQDGIYITNKDGKQIK